MPYCPFFNSSVVRGRCRCSLGLAAQSARKFLFACCFSRCVSRVRGTSANIACGERTSNCLRTEGLITYVAVACVSRVCHATSNKSNVGRSGCRWRSAGRSRCGGRVPDWPPTAARSTARASRDLRPVEPEVPPEPRTRRDALSRQRPSSGIPQSG